MKYTEEFKQSVIARYATRNESVKSILEDAGIPKSTFYGWLKESNKEPVSITSTYNATNFHRMKDHIEHLEGVISVLKEVNYTVNSPRNEKISEIDRLYSKYPLRVLCDALDVSRGTYYNHMLRNKGSDTWYMKRREELKVLIQQEYDDSGQRYGGNTIAASLRKKGEKVSNKLVIELCQELGISSIRNGAKKTFEKNNEPYRNKLKRNFTTDAPNKIWISDITYYRFKNHTFYICVILDLYSRKIISYKVSKRNSTNLVKMTIKSAYESRHPESGLILHSDRGSNYKAAAVEEYLSAHGITHSFSAKGNPYDNSVMESFFSTLKREELYRRDYSSEREFRKALDEYVIFHDEKRIRRNLGNKTPSEYEAAYFSKINDSTV